MHYSFRPLAFVVLLPALAVFASCSKDAAAPASTSTQLLVGQWQLAASTNGMTGRTSPADPNQRQELVFTAAGQLTTFVNGTAVSTTSYALQQRQSPLTQRLETYLVTTPNQMQVAQTVHVDATTLTIAIDAYDGPGATYRRM